MCKGEDGGRHQVQLDGGPESDRREARADDPSTIQNLQRRGSKLIYDIRFFFKQITIFQAYFCLRLRTAIALFHKLSFLL